VLIALVGGLRIRRAAWDFTYGAHFQGDLGNAFFWGQECADLGLFHLYDAVDDQTISDPGRKIDYGPLRLTIAASWRRWAKWKYPDDDQFQDDYDFVFPLLAMNTTAELAAAALMFLVIRLWRRRQAQEGTLTAWTGVWPGIAGAVLFWLNPAIIWNAHCWPQWDVLLIPFFLAAVLLASTAWWFTAGVCVAIGASLKGQMLLGAPVLLIWPIARLRFGCAFRLATGFLVATLIIAVPWMQPGPAALWWGGATMVGIGLVLPFLFEWNLPRWAVWAMVPAAMILAWPWGAVLGSGVFGPARRRRPGHGHAGRAHERGRHAWNDRKPVTLFARLVARHLGNDPALRPGVGVGDVAYGPDIFLYGGNAEIAGV
jgi:hypothetical protein